MLSCANKVAKQRVNLYIEVLVLVIYLICSGQASLTRKQIYVIFAEL